MNTLNLPLYSAQITDTEDGIYAVSLVECPATETSWLCFSKDEQIKTECLYSIQNEEEHILTGPIMLCNVPIYRRMADGYEFNIVYTKDTIKVMAEKMLHDMSHNNIDLEHDGNLLDNGKVQLIELYIVDKEKGISPTFVDVPDYSLMASYKVHDDELWKMCKNGTFTGFSLAGNFGLEKLEFKTNKKNMLKNIKEKIVSLLMEFSEVKTDNGVLYWAGDAELAEGTEVTNENDEPAADGEYTTDDGKVITVKDGKVVSIVDAEAEVADEEPAEEMADEDVTEEVVEEPAAEAEPVENPELAELRDMVNTLAATVDRLVADVDAIKATLAEPAAEPIVEEFTSITNKTVKENKAAKMASYLK